MENLKRIGVEQERIFRILGAMKDGIVITGHDHKIRYLNDVMLQEFGAGQGLFCYEYFHGKEAICEPCHHTEIGEDKYLRRELAYKNGRTYDVIIAPFTDIDGAPCCLSFLRDITEKRLLEQQLLHARKMEAIGALAGGVAHKFNNILTAISGYTSLMKVQIDKGHPFYPSLEAVEGATKRAADMNQQLLGFARKGKYRVELVDLNQIVEKVLGFLRETLDPAIQVEVRLEQDLCPLKGDRNQLEQMLLNICLNARDALPEGGSIIIKTASQELKQDDTLISLEAKAGDFLLLQVIDTGIGIPREAKEKIFDPFFTTKDQASGMGLPMVYGIVKNHGGFITVISEEGQGSSFNVYLPVSERACVEEKKKVNKKISRGQERILLVDDEESLRDVGKRLLEALGYDVLLAGNGREAIEIYETNKDAIDLVVLDMIMPMMSGSETYERLKEINSGVRVLLSSGYCVNGQVQEILDKGVHGFIQKPFGLDEFASAIRNVLDK